MEPPRHTSVVRFGTYEVSLQSGEVRKAGVKIRVQQQPMKLLEILLERPGQVVTREELRGRVWPDESFGDFDQAVNIAIGKLRSALGDSAENPRYIETLPKRGYRFIAEVSVVAEDDRTKKPESATGTIPAADTGHQIQRAGLIVEPKHRQWLANRVIGAIALALVLSLAILAVWLFRARGPAPTGIRSLAVLPLDAHRQRRNTNLGRIVERNRAVLHVDKKGIESARIRDHGDVGGAREPRRHAQRDLAARKPLLHAVRVGHDAAV